MDALFDLRAPYRRNAIWVMSSATLALARKLKDLNGNYLWAPGLNGAVESADGTLLGKRVVIEEQLDGSMANVRILVGDFKRGYESVRVGPLTLIRDDVKNVGFVKFYLRQRVGSRLVDNDAVRAIKANQ